MTGGSLSFTQRLDEIRSGFEPAFWVANVSELFERLSYYAAFASLARYLHETLNFPVEQAGSLTGLFGGLVWFLAAFGGTLADRLGFRRSLSLAYLILSCSYFLLGSLGAAWSGPQHLPRCRARRAARRVGHGADHEHVVQRPVVVEHVVGDRGRLRRAEHG